MFGRVTRAADGAAAFAVLGTYSPARDAGIAAVGLGGAGVASAGLAQTADGRPVSGVGAAVGGAIEWGRRAQRRFVTLPPRVLVVADGDAVSLYEWSLARGKGRRTAQWRNGTYTAERVRYGAQAGVRVVTEHGKVAILTAQRGAFHRHVRKLVDAVVTGAAPPPSA